MTTPNSPPLTAPYTSCPRGDPSALPQAVPPPFIHRSVRMPRSLVPRHYADKGRKSSGPALPRTREKRRKSEGRD
jgi:hypothetical protein